MLHRAVSACMHAAASKVENSAQGLSFGLKFVHLSMNVSTALLHRKIQFSPKVVAPKKCKIESSQVYLIGTTCFDFHGTPPSTIFMQFLWGNKLNVVAFKVNCYSSTCSKSF